MSGGSFDYTYSKLPGDLISEYRERELRQMADAIDEGWRCAADLDEEQQRRLASTLRALAFLVEGARQTVEHHFDDETRNLLKAIEWVESGDSSPERVAKAFEEWEETPGDEE